MALSVRKKVKYILECTLVLKVLTTKTWQGYFVSDTSQVLNTITWNVMKFLSSSAWQSL